MSIIKNNLAQKMHRFKKVHKKNYLQEALITWYHSCILVLSLLLSAIRVTWKTKNNNFYVVSLTIISETNKCLFASHAKQQRFASTVVKTYFCEICLISKTYLTFLYTVPYWNSKIWMICRSNTTFNNNSKYYYAYFQM